MIIKIFQVGFQLKISPFDNYKSGNYTFYCCLNFPEKTILYFRFILLLNKCYVPHNEIMFDT